MSCEILSARFPDGTVSYGVYDRAFDVAYSNRHATRKKAWANVRAVTRGSFEVHRSP